ncbi:MAG: S8 family serine peptidase [Bacteroidota bacterium]
MARYCKMALWGLIWSLAPLSAWGQVELIVRLTDEAPEDLHQTLAEAPAKRGEVLSSRLVFRQSGASKARRDLTTTTWLLTAPDSAAWSTLREQWAGRAGVAYVQANHRYALDGLALDGLAIDGLALDSNAAETGSSSVYRGPGHPASGWPSSRYDDPLLDSLAHLSVIRTEPAWRITRGAGVQIGVLDTGIDFSHPDLADRRWVNPGEDLNGNGRLDPSDYNGRDDDGNGFVDDLYGFDFVDRATPIEAGDYTGRDAFPDEDPAPGGGRGHGTFVAGVLSATGGNEVGIVGVAPEAQLVSLRAFGSDGLGEDDDVAAAIVYAADLGVEVINLSFGDVYWSPLMHEAIRYAVSQGTVMVASAGNVGGDAPHYPSDYPEVLSVAWLDAAGAGIAGRGTFGVGIDLGAPGSGIFTTLFPRPDQDPAAITARYGRRSGSSVAAPMVAGAAALLKAVDATLSPASIRSTLTATAEDLGEPGWDQRTAAGRLNVGAALQRALPGRIELLAPDFGEALDPRETVVIGTVLDPDLVSYQVFYTPGAEDITEAWTPLSPVQTGQVWRDTLAVWPTTNLPDSAYTLRLVATVGSGQPIEVRHRVVLDRTPPTLTVRETGTALLGPYWGVTVDLETDDLTEVTLNVLRGPDTLAVQSDRRTRRHGVSWWDTEGRGGPVTIELIARNVAGLVSRYKRSLEIPAAVSAWPLERAVLQAPHGFLLPQLTDFDDDGLRELVFNRYQDGWVGDSLMIYEWGGGDVQRVQTVLASVIPRDVGDGDGDGRRELLTQVGGATLVLEAPEARRYPTALAFADTVGLRNPFDDAASFGTRYVDFEGDGQQELLVHNTRAWRVLGAQGETYAERFRLENPTGVGRSEIDRNEFQQAEALYEDLDGDGRAELLVGDSDGDWIMYASPNGGLPAPIWTFETDRYNAGDRLAAGRLLDQREAVFATFTQNWTQATRTGEREPDLGRLYLWISDLQGGFQAVDSLLLPGPLSRHGSLVFADLDQDGGDELVVSSAPHLYVLSWTAEQGWQLRLHQGPVRAAHPTAPPVVGAALDTVGVRSTVTVAGDLDGDGRTDLVAASRDGRMHWWRWAGRPAVEPPRWVQAFPQDDSTLVLTWSHPGADSVRILAAPPGGALDVQATWRPEEARSMTASLRRLAVSDVALQAWRGGSSSPLTARVQLVPHAPARVVDVTRANADRVDVRFSLPLAPSTAPGSFRIGAQTAETVTLSEGGTVAQVRFAEALEEGQRLVWQGVTDHLLAPVADTSARIPALLAAPRELRLASWEIDPDSQVVVLRFSASLDPASAQVRPHYRVEPAGQVEAVSFDPERPAEVRVRIGGIPLGPTGQSTRLIVDGVEGQAGEALAAEGNTVILSQAATSLADVYTYPNPYRADRHPERVTVAGLTPGARVRIYSATGLLVRSLEATDQTGGLLWDLRDERGALVPSGLYLLRVEADGQEAVLHKTALIR